MRCSVIIPTYNRRHLLGGAIESALAEAAGDDEVVVVDDDSTDGTVAWLAEKFRDNRVRCVRNSRAKGPAGGRNTGILHSGGDLVAFLDSDDVFLPGHLTACRALFEHRQDVHVIFGRALYERDGLPHDYMAPNFDRKLALAPKSYVDTDMSVFDEGFFDHLLQAGCWFNLSTVVLRREAALELMDESLRISEDYEFWARLARSRRFACLHRPQIRYALHDSNISFAAQSTAADNAPDLLLALRTMRAYPNLSRHSLGLIDDQVASILFDWAYRSTTRGRVVDALRMHCASMLRGRRAANLMAILKLPATLLFRAVR